MSEDRSHVLILHGGGDEQVKSLDQAQHNLLYIFMQLEYTVFDIANG